MCSFENPQTINGGVLVHDGYGPEQDNCYEQYVCAFGMPGTYRVRIRHMYGDIVGKRAKLTIIRYQGTERETKRELTVQLGEEDQVIRLSLEHGRRDELAYVDPTSRIRRTAPRRRSLLQMVGRLDADSRRAARQFGSSRDKLGYQPIITTLSEGVTMSALAVVSGDRRYVRITTVPNFTNITDVFTFSFTGGGGGGGGAGGGGGVQGGGIQGGGGGGNVQGGGLGAF